MHLSTKTWKHAEQLMETRTQGKFSKLWLPMYRASQIYFLKEKCQCNLGKSFQIFEIHLYCHDIIFGGWNMERIGFISQQL